MPNQFDNSGRAQTLLDRIRRATDEVSFSKFFGKPYLAEGEHYRLCNLVLQGGGTLGIAHLGFLRGLEAANVRFAGLAGTSAGAIVALLVAAARKDQINRQVADELLPILQTMPAAAFMDGPYLSRRFVKFALDKRRSGYLEYVLPALASVRQLLSRYGLNRGYRFEDWLAQVLSRTFDLRTQNELDALLAKVAVKLRTNGTSEANHLQLLHITATAMPIGLKIVFPQHAKLFHAKYAQRSPALFARASMSVPLFFEPLDVDISESAWNTFVDEPGQVDSYSDDVLRRMKLLRTLSFIDGGLLSNFPIDAFLGNAICGDTPTVGVALVSTRTSLGNAPRGSPAAFLEYAGATVSAMRHLRDREGFARAQQVELTSGIGTKVAFVDTGPHNWLNFNLPVDDMRDLYVRGLDGCAEFLERLCREKQK